MNKPMWPRIASRQPAGAASAPTGWVHPVAQWWLFVNRQGITFCVHVLAAGQADVPAAVAAGAVQVWDGVGAAVAQHPVHGAGRVDRHTLQRLAVTQRLRKCTAQVVKGVRCHLNH